MLRKIGIKMRYYLLGTGVVVAAFPGIFILSMVAAILLEMDVSEEEMNLIGEGIGAILTISSIYIWGIIFWLLNKRFNFKNLNSIMTGIIAVDFIDLFIPFFIDSQEKIDSITNYTFLIGGILVLKFGLKIFYSEISFYNLRKTYSIFSITGGFFAIIAGILFILKFEITTTIGVILLLLLLLIAIAFTIVKMILLWRAHRDKVIEGLI